MNEARREMEIEAREQRNKAQRARAAGAREHQERYTPHVLFREDGTYLNEGAVRRRCVRGTWRQMRQRIPWSNIGGVPHCEAHKLVEVFDAAGRVSLQLVGKLGVGVIESPEDLYESRSAPGMTGMDISSRPDWQRRFERTVSQRRRKNPPDVPLAQQPDYAAAVAWVCEDNDPRNQPVQSLQDAMPFEFMADLGDSGIVVYVRQLQDDQAKGQPGQ
jgi:hypothetical protein